MPDLRPDAVPEAALRAFEGAMEESFGPGGRTYRALQAAAPAICAQERQRIREALRNAIQKLKTYSEHVCAKCGARGHCEHERVQTAAGGYAGYQEWHKLETKRIECVDRIAVLAALDSLEEEAGVGGPDPEPSDLHREQEDKRVEQEEIAKGEP